MLHADSSVTCIVKLINMTNICVPSFIPSCDITLDPIGNNKINN
jgi:hypothetical protein